MIIFNFRRQKIDKRRLHLVRIFPIGPRGVEQRRVFEVVNFLDLRRHVACWEKEEKYC